MHDPHHNIAPVTEDLIRAGNELYYAAVSLLGRGETPLQPQEALTGWRELMERQNETH